MSLRFFGLSGHLVSGASGHFETFHKGLFKAFKEILGEENCNFLGSQSSEGENLWFEANLPDSLTSTIPWVSKGFLDSAFDSVDEVGNSHILYVYEGNLTNLFLIGNIARRKSNVFIYFNLFNSYKYNSKFESKGKLLVFKLLFLLALRGLEGRIFLTADTKRFADFLSKKLGKTFSEYPMYSALKYKLGSDNQRKRVLINFRFQKSQELIQVAIEKIVDLQEIGLDLHGIYDENVTQALSVFPNIRILNDPLDELSYFDLYSKYYRIAFIYDPEFFSMQSSGRLMDAIIAGAELVVPRDTAMEDVLLEYGNGSSFSFNDYESLADALISEPKVAKQVDYLPTSSRAAQSILNSMEKLLNNDSPSTRNFRRILDIALDEGIRHLLWLLRVIFGVKNYFQRYLGGILQTLAPKAKK